MWSEPTSVFHHAENRGHHPALAIDRDQVFHMVFYVEGADGSSSLAYSRSEDEGRNWTLPETIVENRQPFPFFKPPKLVADSAGTLHVSWSHLRKKMPDGTQGAVSFYAIRRRGEWSQPQQLFAELEPKTPVLLALDGQDVAHAVFLAAADGGYRIYHARQR